MLLQCSSTKYYFLLSVHLFFLTICSDFNHYNVLLVLLWIIIPFSKFSLVLYKKSVSNRLFVFVGELVFFFEKQYLSVSNDASVYSKTGKCMFVSDAELYSVVSKCLFKSIVSMKKGGRFKIYCKCLCHLSLFTIICMV